MKRKYIRTDSNCVCIMRNPEDKRYSYCDGLTDDAFEDYVLRGYCGTYLCPFYKPQEVKKDPGNWVACMR